MNAKNSSRYRPFRKAMLVAYIGVAVVLGLLTNLSAWRGAHERNGIAPPPASPDQVGREAITSCMRELESLSVELNRRLDATLASWPARRSSVEWEDWSPAWRKRLLEAGARCRLEEGDVPGTADLREVWRRLGQLHRHYTTLAVQFSKEIGPHADGLHQALEKARRSAPPP